METISRNEIFNHLQRGDSIRLVEALPENFYEAGHLPGAIAIPMGFVADLAPRLLPDKKQVIVVYCSGSICQNSLHVAEELQQLGYAAVKRYIEGKEDWKQAGLPMERATATAFAEP